MRGVLFGTKHSYDDFKLILTDKSISLPTPKTSSVNVEGRDGVIDTSEVLTGDIKFNNRKLDFEFTMTTPYDEFNELLTEIASAIHGRKLKIVLDEDDEYYYVGRCSINEWTTDKRVGKIAITCDCEPYKYTLKNLVKVAHIEGDTQVQLYGRRMSVNPTITVTNHMTLLYEGKTYNLEPNVNNELLDVFIVEGKNTLNFNGNGTVNISYLGGEL